jgi:hypothetical protein
MWNLVSHIKWATWAKGIWAYGAEKCVSGWDRGGDRGVINGECTARSFAIGSLTKYYPLGLIQKNGIGGACGTYGERQIAHRVLAAKPEEKRKLEKPKCRWSYNFNMDLKSRMETCTGFIWLMTESSGGLLWTRQWIIFHKLRRIS